MQDQRAASELRAVSSLVRSGLSPKRSVLQLQPWAGAFHFNSGTVLWA
jgi:hypothetical protein